MRVSATFFCDQRLTPALTWLDSIRWLRQAPAPTVPVPWDVDWARRLQTKRHVTYDDGYVVTLVTSILPLVDHLILGHINMSQPKLVHGGLLVFGGGETWSATPAQELRLAVSL